MKAWSLSLIGCLAMIITTLGAGMQQAAAEMAVTSTNGTAISGHLEVDGTGNDDGVRGESIGDGVVGHSTGNGDLDNGVIGYAEEGYGVYGFSNGVGQYGGYFADPIYASGGCTGCTLSVIAENNSGTTLEKGDLVRPDGVRSVRGQQPVMQVSRASFSEEVVGVVVGAVKATMTTEEDDDMQPGVYYGPIGGTAGPGDHLVVLVQGMAQVKMSPQARPRAGQSLSMKDGRRSFGRALGGPNEEGLTWVLFGVD